MLKKILELKSIKHLEKSEQKNINGGIIILPVVYCFCITRDPRGFLVISEDVPCDSTCEDGSRPVQF